jgi:hypothetical protein
MTDSRFALAAQLARPIAPVGPPRPAAGERFVRGPIPRGWLEAAMRLRGKALHVAIELWYRAGLRSRGEVVLSLSNLSNLCGFDRATAARALTALERAGLVRVARHVGRAPRVTILERREHPVQAPSLE